MTSNATHPLATALRDGRSAMRCGAKLGRLRRATKCSATRCDAKLGYSALRPFATRASHVIHLLVSERYRVHSLGGQPHDFGVGHPVTDLVGKAHLTAARPLPAYCP